MNGFALFGALVFLFVLVMGISTAVTENKRPEETLWGDLNNGVMIKKHDGHLLLLKFQNQRAMLVKILDKKDLDKLRRVE